MAIRYAKQITPKTIAKHYTPPALAARLVSLVPYDRADIVLDPSAGKNQVFIKQVKARRKIACELDEGKDFLTLPLAYDWAITNPPYHLLWAFIDKTSQEARKGFGFLVNINGINTLTPKRLTLLQERGFHLRHLHVCNVKAWMGRYYYYIFRKQEGLFSHTWDIKSWT